MITEPRSYDLEFEMLKKLKNGNSMYEEFIEFTNSTGRGRRHFKNYLNNRNIWIELDSYGNPQVTLHGTVIMRFLPHAIRLSHGGWKTHLTKTWINRLLSETEFEYLYQENYEWLMYRRSEIPLIREINERFININSTGKFGYTSMTESQRRKHNKENVTIPKNKLLTLFENDMLVNWR